MTPHVSITLLRTQTDERLLELIAAGHDRAFEAVVDRYRRPLLRYARRFLPEEARAEDVVQAAFVSAWGALRDGAPVRDLRPWLYRIVHNGALNVMKKPGGDDAPLIEASDLRPGPAAAVEQREDVRRALDTIAALPERQRAALLAVAVDGRSHADVGADLGINDTAVRQLVSRARASLRVAATAVTPWPVAVWLAGIGGAQAADTATRVGEIVGGVGAGTLFGGGALKAGAVVAAAGAVAVGAPQVRDVVRERERPAAAQAAEPASARNAASAPAGAPPALASAPAGALAGGAPSKPARPADRERSSSGGGSDDRDDPRADGTGPRDDEPGPHSGGDPHGVDDDRRGFRDRLRDDDGEGPGERRDPSGETDDGAQAPRVDRRGRGDEETELLAPVMEEPREGSSETAGPAPDSESDDPPDHGRPGSRDDLREPDDEPAP